jgi:hypothetical protein
MRVRDHLEGRRKYNGFFNRISGEITQLVRAYDQSSDNEKAMRLGLVSLNPAIHKDNFIFAYHPA